MGKCFGLSNLAGGEMLGLVREVEEVARNAFKMKCII